MTRRTSPAAFVVAALAACLCALGASAARAAEGALDSTFNPGMLVVDFGGAEDAARAVLIQPDGKIVAAGSGRTFDNANGFALVRYNADGTPDTSFGSGGKVVYNFGLFSAWAEAVALQADGRILVVGSYWNSMVLARFNADGSPDTSFSADGTVTTSFDGGIAKGMGVAVQPDGKIVIVGSFQASGGATDFALARYTAAGAPDTTFGAGGKLVIPNAAGYEVFNDVAVQPDGKIVAAGVSGNMFAAARFTAAGVLDATFGTGGVAAHAFGGGSGSAQAMSLRPDGKIVLAGRVGSGYYNAVVARLTPSGAPDATFGAGGSVTTDFGVGMSFGEDVFAQPDGKIVVAGSAVVGSRFQFALARFDASGAPDASFGAGGKSIVVVGTVSCEASAAALHTDGRIVLAGHASASGTSDGGDFALMRYHADGSRDASLHGAGGKVTTAVSGSFDYAEAVLLQAGGKLLVAGSSFGTTDDFSLVRYTADGTLDASFGAAGKVSTHMGANERAHDMAAQPDGKIVLVGTADNGFSFAVARYTAAGAPDTTFGTGGYVETDLNAGETDEAQALALQADGRIVVAGGSRRADDKYDFSLARYTAAGVLDATFGTGGVVHTRFNGNEHARAVVVLPTGKILAAGGGYQNDPADFALARYNANGTLDTTFGAGGKVTTDFGARDTAHDMLVQPDGRIVLVGARNQGGVTDFAVARYNADGSPDQSFGAGGKLTTDFGGADEAYRVALQQNGKILVAGHGGAGKDFALARYLADGVPDPDFGDAGRVLTDFGSTFDRAFGMLVQPDAHIVLVGSVGVGTNQTDTALARYEATNRAVGSLRFKSAAYNVGEAAGAALITVERVDGSEGAVTVNYATANLTAAWGEDYTPAAGTLSFAAGETTKTFTVAVANDRSHEPNETIALSLSNPTGNAALAARQSTATLNILDDDAPTNNAAFVTQNVPARMFAGKLYDLTVHMRNTGTNTWSTAGGYGLASEGPADNTTWGVSRVPLSGSVVADGNHYFVSQVVAPATPGTYQMQWRMTQDGVGRFGAPTAAVSVVVSPPPDVTINDVSVSEGDSGETDAVFAVRLSRAVEDEIKVYYGTNPGTAANNVDFIGTGGILTFAPGETTQTISVAVKGDRVLETDETFRVNVSANHVNVTDGQAIGTIVNDDEQTAAGQVVISEFRLAGPGPGGAGAGADEFFELYNNTDAAITVATADGSAGWVLRSSDSTLAVTIPNGQIIPARGHYLLANPAGYSLAAYPAGAHGCPGGNCASANRTFTSDTPENTGVALFRTANPANFTAANRLDAAGPATEADALYREGDGYAPLAGAAGAVQHSLVRKLLAGTPRDRDDNAGDFVLVAAGGASALPGSVLGLPGPENSNSPVQRNNEFKSAYVDPTCGGATGTAVASPTPGGANDGAPLAGCQNRARDLAPGDPAHSANGTLYIRRRFVNKTGQSVTRLRFRVVDVTAGAAPAGTADLRLLSSGAVTLTTTAGETIAVKGLTLELTPAQPQGGGINSTVSVATVTTATPLAPGASVAVQFRLGVRQTGNFRFFVNVEALPGPLASPPPAATAAPAFKGGVRAGAKP